MGKREGIDVFGHVRNSATGRGRINWLVVTSVP